MQLNPGETAILIEAISSLYFKRETVCGSFVVHCLFCKHKEISIKAIFLF